MSWDFKGQQLVPGHTYLPGSPVASPTLQVHGDTRQIQQGFRTSSGPLWAARNARHLPKLAPHAHGPREVRNKSDKADKNKPERRQAGRQAGKQESGKKAEARQAGAEKPTKTSRKRGEKNTQAIHQEITQIEATPRSTQSKDDQHKPIIKK